MLIVAVSVSAASLGGGLTSLTLGSDESCASVTPIEDRRPESSLWASPGTVRKETDLLPQRQTGRKPTRAARAYMQPRTCFSGPLCWAMVSPEMPRCFAAALPLFFVFAACGDDLSITDPPAPRGSSGGAADAGACEPGPAPEKPAASCDVTIERVPVRSSINHVPEGTAITYCSNPPANGDHYPVWAAFQEYDKPIQWPYLVHSMEHGAVLLLYKCEGPCPEIVDGLRRVRDAIAADPLCDAATPRRIIIAPSPTLDSTVAAASWNAILKAPCVDVPTLENFVRSNYALGPENFCIPGRIF
jgi:hypothetical protein